MSKKAAKKEEAPPTPKEEPKAEEKKEEVKPQKAEKPKREKKKEKGIHALYKVEGEKVTRLRPVCERCGTGYFMGEHKDRYTCGHCGFTRYKTH